MDRKEEIMQLVVGVETLTAAIKKLLVGEEKPHIPEGNLLCPDCGGAMKLRANRVTNEKFYGCIKYPDCRGTRDSEGLSRADREERKYKQEQTSQQTGFSFNKKNETSSG